jgi:hypothetical protein
MMLAKLRAALEILLVMSEVNDWSYFVHRRVPAETQREQKPTLPKTILLFPEKNHPNILSNA